MDLNSQQFLYHGTASDIKGDKILPATVHGGHSHWGDAGTEWGEPSKDHAWAHPDEQETWHFAMDRSLHAGINSERRAGADYPRPRVHAVEPNDQMTPGSGGVKGEFKAPHFNIAHTVDIMPGRQGTFPEVNWNEHVTQMSKLPEDEDANHPKDKSVTFGHANPWADHWNGPMRQEARDMDTQHYMQGLDDRNIKPKYEGPEPTLPGMVNPEQFGPRGRR